MKYLLILPLFYLLLLNFTRCATDPGSGASIGGSPIIFTYATGEVRVIISANDSSITAAAVLFDTDPVTGVYGRATELEEGVSVTWPDELSLEIPDCNQRPLTPTSETYPLFRIFTYIFPDTCTSTSEEVQGQATLVVSKNGASKTLNDTSSGVTEQTFTSSGTWLAPAGVTAVTVETWGAGGGGGGALGLSGSGGGGGAYAKSTSIAVVPGNSYTVTVGAGGAAGIGGGTTLGGTGGDSWFSTVGTILAKGGTGGDHEGTATVGSGGTSGASIGDTKYSGGDASSPSAARAGGGGSSAGSDSNGNDGQPPGGGGGPGGAAPLNGGAGGNGGDNSEAGLPGTSPGGGGGGGSGNPANEDGGAGAGGKVIISWD